MATGSLPAMRPQNPRGWGAEASAGAEGEGDTGCSVWPRCPLVAKTVRSGHGNLDVTGSGRASRKFVTWPGPWAIHTLLKLPKMKAVL